LVSQRNLLVAEGSFDIHTGPHIIINQDILKKYNLNIGDWILIDCKTIYGAWNPLDFKIVGTYKNRAPWDNWLVFMSKQNARLLFAADEEMWDVAQIILHTRKENKRLAQELNEYLNKESALLLAEPYEEACTFLMNLSGNFRVMYIIFVFFLIFIIALGIRSTVRMNIFERRQEFGTLRAIGYPKFITFLILFFELLFLSLFALAAATLISLSIIAIFAIQGIYVGSGPMSYMYGGDHIYPFLNFIDVVFTLFIITVLSLFAPLKPALNLNMQRITDILHKRQKKIIVSLAFLKHMISRKAAGKK